MTQTIVSLYRYPIKGLSPERLQTVRVNTKDGLPLDREFALALGTTVFDEANPEPLDKGFFLMLRSNERLAELNTVYDAETGLLRLRDGTGFLIEASLHSAEGRKTIERFFLDFLGDETRGWPKLVRSPGHKFSDASVMSPELMRAVSLINLASVEALSEAVGEPINPLRFRGNIYVSGMKPFEELSLVDREIQIGAVSFRGLARTPRCAAVNVNPDTAKRDLNLPKAIVQNFGHTDLGVYLEVLGDGAISVGDEMQLG